MTSNQALLVSIILPTYNGVRYMHQAIKSCLEQTYRTFELIIIDDGSTEDVVAVVKSFNDSRIHFIRLEQNQGHIAALNHGFVLSKGKLLTWTSDDNCYDPQAIERMVEELTNDQSIDFVYTRYHVIDEAGNIQRQGRSEPPAYLDIDNCVGGCFLYRRRVYEMIGDFNSDAFLAEDYEYWLRVRLRFRMKLIDQVLYYYREHPKSLTGIHKEQRVQEQVIKIRNRFRPLSKKVYFYITRQLRWVKSYLRL